MQFWLRQSYTDWFTTLQLLELQGPSYRVKGLVENIQFPDIKQQTQKVGRPRNNCKMENYMDNEELTKEKKQRKSSVNTIDLQQYDNEN